MQFILGICFHRLPVPKDLKSLPNPPKRLPRASQITLKSSQNPPQMASETLLGTTWEPSMKKTWFLKPKKSARGAQELPGEAKMEPKSLPKPLPNPPKIHWKTQSKKTMFWQAFFHDFHLKIDVFFNDFFLRSSVKINIKINAFLEVLSASFFNECEKCNFAKTVILHRKNWCFQGSQH